jgi:two-component system nitrate/nitrite response regulator NarL
MMLTVSENEDDLIGALRAGADGYLLKTTDADQLTDSIVKVLTGESVVSPEMTSKLVSALRQTRAEPTPSMAGTAVPGAKSVLAELAEGLSSREMEILRLIARGDSNKLIARELDIAETTVKIHVQHILRKLSVTSRVQAAVYAVHHGIR